MKRLPLVLTLVASLVLAVGPVSADDAKSVISGGGWRLTNETWSPPGTPPGLPKVEFLVNAWITENGRVSGLYKYGNVSGLLLSGPLTCAKVAGNRAVIGGPISRTSDSAFAGTSFLVFLTDNGRHQFGQIGPDIVSQTYISPVFPGTVGDMPADFPAHCPAADGAASNAADAFEVLGDIAVRSGN